MVSSPGCRQIRWRRTAAAVAAAAAAAAVAVAVAGEEAAAAAPPTVPPPLTAFGSLTHTGREGTGLAGGRDVRGWGRATSGGGAEEALGNCSSLTERKKKASVVEEPTPPTLCVAHAQGELGGDCCHGHRFAKPEGSGLSLTKQGWSCVFGATGFCVTASLSCFTPPPTTSKCPVKSHFLPDMVVSLAA